MISRSAPNLTSVVAGLRVVVFFPFLPHVNLLRCRCYLLVWGQLGHECPRLAGVAKSFIHFRKKINKMPFVAVWLCGSPLMAST